MQGHETWGDYALKGKALCGECGRSLQGISGYGCKGVRYEYDSCPTKCQKNIRRDVLEGEIVKALRTMLSDRSTAMMIARALCGLQSHGALNAEKKRAQKALSDAEKGLKNLLAAVEQGIIVPGTQERIQELEAQKLRAQRDLENAKAEEVDPEGFADFLDVRLRSLMTGTFLRRSSIGDAHAGERGRDPELRRRERRTRPN